MLLPITLALVCSTYTKLIALMANENLTALPRQTQAVIAKIPYIKPGTMVTILPLRVPAVAVAYYPPVARESTVAILVTNTTSKPLNITTRTLLGGAQYHYCTKSGAA